MKRILRRNSEKTELRTMRLQLLKNGQLKIPPLLGRGFYRSALIISNICNSDMIFCQ